MPQEGVQRTVPAAVDGLEVEFLRRAIRGVLQSKARADVRFLWIIDQGQAMPCPEVPFLELPSRLALTSLLRGHRSALEEVLESNHVDLLFTRIDRPVPGVKLPKVLFALDMRFQSDTPVVAQSLPRKIRQHYSGASSIICPSEYVHKACASRLEIGLEKVSVARPGVDPIFSEEQDPIIEGAYALFILNRYTLPAIPTLLAAIQRNKSLFPPNLVVLGCEHPGEPESWQLPLVRIEKCPDAMVASLMQHAQVCLYPAKGDGSGMVILQAMAAGASLVASKSGAGLEVAGASCFYCEPDNPTSLLQVMRRMLDESPEEREKRRQMAKSLVADSTWERCGAKIVSALRRSRL